jgi:hypothetical protein
MSKNNLGIINFFLHVKLYYFYVFSSYTQGIVSLKSGSLKVQHLQLTSCTNSNCTMLQSTPFAVLFILVWTIICENNMIEVLLLIPEVDMNVLKIS